MDHNPYQPPVARVEDAPPPHEQRFYVVAPGKFLLLMIGTLSTYQLYWFYRNWSLLNRRHKQYWPIPRALFAVFFTHSLFEEIDGAIRQRGATHRWAWSSWATLYVGCAVISYILGRLAARDIGSPVTDIVNLVLTIPLVWSLYVAQRAINVAEGDPAGASNRRITIANVVWLVLFAFVWVVMGFGLYVILNPEQFN